MADDSPLETLLSASWNAGLSWAGFARYATKNRDQFAAAYEGFKIAPEAAERFQAIDDEVRLLVIGADWCGDVVANLPALARLAELNPKIQLRIVDRDHHEPLMDRFMTGDARAIPVIIASDPSFTTHRRWGPRPEPCQRLMLEHKGKLPKEQIIPMIREWYKEDRNQTLLAEVYDLIASVTPARA